MTKHQILAFTLGLIAGALFAHYLLKKNQESNWKPEYADPNKLKRSMMGMASEGNSVAGMIANPKFGAMVHS